MAEWRVFRGVAVAATGAVVALVAGAQVRCLMPNGIWIAQRLAQACPAGAVQAQTMDGQPVDGGAPAPAPAVPASPAAVSTRQAMSFDACVRLMSKTVADVGGRNVRVLLSTPQGRTVRICTEDGSVLMTCSRPDAQMVTTMSAQVCDG